MVTETIEWTDEHDQILLTKESQWSKKLTTHELQQKIKCCKWTPEMSADFYIGELIENIYMQIPG